MKKWTSYIGICLLFMTMSSCRYGFKGTSISTEVNTFFVSVFDVGPQNAPVIIGQDFSNLLTDKIRSESRLDPVSQDADIEFQGTISRYQVSFEAPQPGETSAFNRLNMSIEVEYIDNNKEDEGWKNTFSFFFDFPSDENLIDIEDEAVDAIFDQLVEDVFNKAFTNW